MSHEIADNEATAILWDYAGQDTIAIHGAGGGLVTNVKKEDYADAVWRYHASRINNAICAITGQAHLAWKSVQRGVTLFAIAAFFRALDDSKTLDQLVTPGALITFAMLGLSLMGIELFLARDTPCGWFNWKQYRILRLLEDRYPELKMTNQFTIAPPANPEARPNQGRSMSQRAEGTESC